MLARYDGTCIICGQRITAGQDLIGKNKDVSRWVHSACTQTAASAGKEPASMQTGPSPHNIKQRLFLDLPYPFRLILEHLKVHPDPLDTFSLEALRAFNAISPSRVSFQALEQLLNAEASAGRSVKVTKASAAHQAGASELIQRLMEQRWVSWDDALMKFKENPTPAPLPPYRKVTAKLQDVGFGPIDISLGSAADAETGSYLVRHPQVAAHHRLLFINVDDDSKASKERPVDKVSSQVVCSLIREGLSLGGRHFSVLFFKHSRDKGTLTLVFFATHEDMAGPSYCPASPASPQLPPMTVEHAVAQLGAVGYLYQTPAKLLERMSLFASGTTPVNIKASMIFYVDDICNRAAGVQGDVMTDGAGIMSLDIAHQIPRSLGGRKLEVAPSASLGATSVVQVRVFDPRGCQPIVSKGTLTPCSALPPSTIIITRSMVKAPPSPILDTWLTQIPATLIPWTDRPLFSVRGLMDQNRMEACLEVANALFDALPGRMNSNIVTLLGDVCAVEPLFTRLIQTDLKKTEKAATDYDASLQLAKSNRFLALQYLLEAKVGCIEDPDSGEWVFRPDAYLAGELHRMQQYVQEDLQAMRFILPEAGRLVGVPDASQSVPQGCCIAVRDGMPWLPAIPPWKPFNALLYRDPGLDPCTDIQPVRIIEPPQEFYAMYGSSDRSSIHTSLCVKNALFFSTQGSVSLASQLASGDFDGDLYVIITYPEVVLSYRDPTAQQPKEHPPQRPEAFFNSPQTKAAALEAAHIPLPDELEDDFVEDDCPPEQQERQQDGGSRFLSAGEIARAYLLHSRVSMQVSKSCILWKKWADLQGPSSEQARTLAHVYMASLDALKTSNLPYIPKDLLQGHEHVPVWDAGEEQQQHARQALLQGEGSKFSFLARLYLLAKGSPFSGPQMHQVMVDEDLESFPGSDDPNLEDLCIKVHSFWRSEWAKFMEDPSPYIDKHAFGERLRHACSQMLFGAPGSFDTAMCSALHRLQVASAFYRLVYNYEANRVPPRLSAPWQICGTELKHIKCSKVSHKITKGLQLLPERVVAPPVSLVRDPAGAAWNQ